MRWPTKPSEDSPIANKRQSLSIAGHYVLTGGWGGGCRGWAGEETLLVGWEGATLDVRVVPGKTRVVLLLPDNSDTINMAANRALIGVLTISLRVLPDSHDSAFFFSQKSVVCGAAINRRYGCQGDRGRGRPLPDSFQTNNPTTKNFFKKK